MDVVQAQMPELVTAINQLTDAMNNLNQAYLATAQATQALGAGFVQIAQAFSQAGDGVTTGLADIVTAIQALPQGTPPA